ncbi:hypothetical protein NQ176_g1642 [Zarea fungicola]|uniref:Uncharacterized protein n=1 Tax=Zarea fungicola TaxID=93591 RepID=A0ACC1NRU4_9HYPO|nr:hypothetical protein NQ176_g1642 [Lecanicillium fungicola]
MMNINGVNNDKTLVTPIWVLAIRIAQVVLSIIILGLAAAWSDYPGFLLDGPSLAIASAVFTWFIVAYILVTEKVAAANPLYNIYVVIALDAFLVVLWLSAWALNAARRSIIISDFAGLLAGVAALGAFVWVSFIATLVWTIMNFLKGRKEGRFALGSASTVTADHNIEEQKAQAQQQQSQSAAQQQPVQLQEHQPYSQYPPQTGQPQQQQPYQQYPQQPQPQQQQTYEQYPQHPTQPQQQQPYQQYPQQPTQPQQQPYP